MKAVNGERDMENGVQHKQYVGIGVAFPISHCPLPIFY